MLLISLLIIPIVGIFFISLFTNSYTYKKYVSEMKTIALGASVVNVLISLYVLIFLNFSSNQFQFVQEYYNISSFDLYLGVDGISIYFVVLTTVIIPISFLSNWSSISAGTTSYIIIILLLNALLVGVFIVLDMLLFYIFFESILPPLFLLIGIFGSDNRIRASFYLFLYTLLGSLFLLLSILTTSSMIGTTDFDIIFKTNLHLYKQILLFCGIFIAFAVKTPTIFLNTWLLKAHVESPLGGSIILAGIVLKLSLYGILRLISPLISKAYLLFTPMACVIGVITILYASVSTIRTTDIKELIAYSSVSHAAVYVLGVFSNTIQGIEGGILLGLGHGFVSSGLFICAGGVLYDRSSTRLITFYRGAAQVMPIFSILFFILCLGNAGTPLSINFVGEFLSLYGTFERLPLLGIFASSSIVFSAAYTIYMFNRIAFAGTFSKLFKFNTPDLSRREFAILFILVLFTIVFGIYPAPLLDGLHYSVSSLIYYNSLLSMENRLSEYLFIFILITRGLSFKCIFIKNFGKRWFIPIKGFFTKCFFKLSYYFKHILLLCIENWLKIPPKPHAFICSPVENKINFTYIFSVCSVGFFCLMGKKLGIHLWNCCTLDIQDNYLLLYFSLAGLIVLLGILTIMLATVIKLLKSNRFLTIFEAIICLVLSTVAFFTVGLIVEFVTSLAIAIAPGILESFWFFKQPHHLIGYRLGPDLEPSTTGKSINHAITGSNSSNTGNNSATAGNTNTTPITGNTGSGNRSISGNTGIPSNNRPVPSITGIFGNSGFVPSITSMGGNSNAPGGSLVPANHPVSGTNPIPGNRQFLPGRTIPPRNSDLFPRNTSQFFPNASIPVTPNNVASPPIFPSSSLGYNNSLETCEGVRENPHRPGEWVRSRYNLTLDEWCKLSFRLQQKIDSYLGARGGHWKDVVTYDQLLDRWNNSVPELSLREEAALKQALKHRGFAGNCVIWGGITDDKELKLIFRAYRKENE